MIFITSVKDKCKDIAKEYYISNAIDIKGNLTSPFAPSDYDISCKRAVYEKLLALNGKGTPEQIKEITGNAFLTNLRCDICEKSVERVAEYGCGEDMQICEGCLRDALEQIELSKELDSK